MTWTLQKKYSISECLLLPNWCIPRSYKVSFLARTYFGSPSGNSPSKIGHNFSNKVVLKLKLSINYFYKKCASKELRILHWRKIGYIWMIFGHRKFTLKVKIGTFWQTVTRWKPQFGNFIWLQLILKFLLFRTHTAC